MKRSTRNHFYTHLVSFEPITIALNEMPMTNEERWELTTIAESHIHITVIDLVLSNLSTEDKKKFLDHMNTRDHVSTWKFLRERTQDMEKKIQQTADTLIEELLKDMQELQKT